MDTAPAVARRHPPTRTRTAGLVLLWGGIVGVVQAVVMLAVPAVVGPDRYSFPFTPGGYAIAQTTFALQHVALVVGVAVLAPMAATAVTRWALHGATAGLVLLTVMELVAITAAGSSVSDPQAELVNSLYGIPTILTGLGLLVGGFGLARGALRWVTVGLGAYVFVVLLPAIVAPYAAGRVAIGVWLLLFGVLGALLARGER
ncbi:hypothetical protein [Pseudonocardia broussonetiae]|uniref:DUF998 domain-containing protein n=1 Tax=Pseudonocardia broussonetiae TaxID=2736640 RepID=A0A6M6JQ19_9PSEU|nr:hypothetical protein [Pseudonocardia broussonetiae]QJY49323.1 hypothetical protein HOP40_29170 [Pseudonocardia broussonetiae]